MSYKFDRAGNILVLDGSGACVGSVPSTDSNLKAWLAAGNTMAPADPPPAPSQDELDLAAAKAYAKLQTLAGMTPAQVQAYVQANVTNIAQAQDAITTLAIAVALMWRRIR